MPEGLELTSADVAYLMEVVGAAQSDRRTHTLTRVDIPTLRNRLLVLGAKLITEEIDRAVNTVVLMPNGNCPRCGGPPLDPHRRFGQLNKDTDIARPLIDLCLDPCHNPYLSPRDWAFREEARRGTTWSGGGA